MIISKQVKGISALIKNAPNDETDNRLPMYVNHRSGRCYQFDSRGVAFINHSIELLITSMVSVPWFIMICC